MVLKYKLQLSYVLQTREKDQWSQYTTSTLNIEVKRLKGIQDKPHWIKVKEQYFSNFNALAKEFTF